MLGFLRAAGAAGLLGLVGLAAATPSGAPPALSSSVQVLDVVHSGPDRLQILVVVPSIWSRLPLTAEAFHVRQSGRSLPLSVARLVPARLDILLLADQAVTPARLLAEQATIAELLRELPVGTAVRLDVAGRFVGGSPTEALGRLAALAPRDSSFDALVRQAVRGWRPAGVPALARAVVLVAGCPTLARLSAGLRSRARGRGQLAFLGLGHGCPAAGGALFSVSAATSNQPIVAASADAAAADRLAARFLGEYELDVATAAGHRLSLVVQALGTTRTASVIVPRAGRTATSRRSAVGHRQAGSASWLDALAAGLVALVALGVAAGVQRLHRQRRQRSGRPSTTRLSA